MDIIAEWLSAARVNGTIFARTELAQPWSLEFPAAPRIAFHIVVRGQAYLAQDSQRGPRLLSQGDVVLLASGSRHVLSSDPTLEPTNIIAYMTANPLGPDRTIRYGAGPASTVILCGAYDLDGANAGPLLALLPAVVHLAAEEGVGSPVGATIQLLQHELQPSATAGDTVQSRLVDVLLVYVLRAWARLRPEDETGWLSALRDPQLATALARVHEHPGRSWTVEELATAAGLSRSAFARRFTAMVGEAPLAYVTRWRLTLAARLLADSSTPIAAIAGRVGYESEFAFNRAFSRQHGLAPGQWRARAREVATSDAWRTVN